MTDPTTTPSPDEPAPAAPAVPWTPPPVAAPTAPAPAATGGAPAMVVADVPNRAIAYIIDIICLGIIGIGVAIVLGAIGLSAVAVNTASTSVNWFGAIIQTVVALAISAAYFIYSWTDQRATIGMKVLGLQIGDAAAGATITTNAAIKRWLALGAAFSIAQLLNPLPLLGLLIGLAAFAWFIFLLYSTWKSPTKQGWHDVFANTMIVKSTKSAV